MSLFEKLRTIIEPVRGDETAKSERKGDDFERYVIDLFLKNNKPKKEYFSIENWSRDISRKSPDITVKSDQHPDLTMCYKGKEYFAVECKFRTDFFYSKDRNGEVLKWSYPDQMKRYQKYQKDKNIPVFIAIGVGGSPKHPKKMYCILLDEAKYPELYVSQLAEYERDPTKPFFWRNGRLS